MEEPTLEDIEHVMEGQAERNICVKSRKAYLSMCKTMTKMLIPHPELYAEAFECTDSASTKPGFHTGPAWEVYRLKLPISEKIAGIIFAKLSIDGDLPRGKGIKRASSRKRKRSSRMQDGDDDDHDEESGGGAELASGEPTIAAAITSEVAVSSETPGTTVTTAESSVVDKKNPGSDS